MRLLSTVKNAFLADHRKRRRIIAGPFRGIVMKLSLRTQLQIYLGLFERETHVWIHRFCEDIHTAVDVGAAYGEYTLFFAFKTSAKRVYAFEPDPQCLEAFHESLAVNNRRRDTEKITEFAAFVGDSKTRGAVTLDSLANSIETPCFVKVDVDGGEEAVLNGAKLLMALRGVSWLIETHSRALEDACVRILREAGYSTEIVTNAWWRVVLPELRPAEHNRWLAAWKN